MVNDGEGLPLFRIRAERGCDASVASTFDAVATTTDIDPDKLAWEGGSEHSSGMQRSLPFSHTSHPTAAAVGQNNTTEPSPAG